MKPTVQEEMEDDIAAEEENKLINEVRLRRRRVFVFSNQYSCAVFLGIQNLV